MNWGIEHYIVLATFAVAVATGWTTFVTYKHVKEAKRSREILEESLQVEKDRIRRENSPVIYIEKINTSYSLDTNKNEIAVLPVANIINGGKSPARINRIEHTLSQNTLKDEKSIEGGMELFQNQLTTFQGKFFLKIEEDLAKEMSTEIENKLPFSRFPSLDNPILWRIKIEYQDTFNEAYIFDSIYEFHYPKWVYSRSRAI